MNYTRLCPESASEEYKLSPESGGCLFSPLIFTPLLSPFSLLPVFPFLPIYYPLFPYRVFQKKLTPEIFLEYFHFG